MRKGVTGRGGACTGATSGGKMGAAVGPSGRPKAEGAQDIWVELPLVRQKGKVLCEFGPFWDDHVGSTNNVSLLASDAVAGITSMRFVDNKLEDQGGLVQDGVVFSNSSCLTAKSMQGRLDVVVRAQRVEPRRACISYSSSLEPRPILNVLCSRKPTFPVLRAARQIRRLPTLYIWNANFNSEFATYNVDAIVDGAKIAWNMCWAWMFLGRLWSLVYFGSEKASLGPSVLYLPTFYGIIIYPVVFPFSCARHCHSYIICPKYVFKYLHVVEGRRTYMLALDRQYTSLKLTIITGAKDESPHPRRGKDSRALKEAKWRDPKIAWQAHRLISWRVVAPVRHLVKEGVPRVLSLRLNIPRVYSSLRERRCARMAARGAENQGGKAEVTGTRET
ncbi:hypothetical protein C8J57DRAFT_1227838 [Mycena rebaudengoi]|nr:hypothetical protein C8J57DRAFT_1254627 [Mycena rebaudengoi]KAJ7269100.1 hypothetical protein C8J57DRAFT_1227838 [Mycena rebaudengoi]